VFPGETRIFGVNGWSILIWVVVATTGALIVLTAAAKAVAAAEATRKDRAAREGKRSEHPAS